MPQYQSLGLGVYCLEAFHKYESLASFYLLEDSGELAIIDCGTTHSIGNLQATLAALGFSAGQVKYVIPTHVHLDHAGGAGEMMSMCAEAKMLVHPRGARHMADPSRLIQGVTAVYGNTAVEADYGTIQPIDEQRITAVNDGDTVTLGSRTLVFLDTPGHAPHHICIVDEVSGGIFTGDTFGLGYEGLKQHPRGLIPTSSPAQFDAEMSFSSVKRIAELAPQRVFLTHYGEYRDIKTGQQSLNYWLNRYVECCEGEKPEDLAGEKRLETRLRQAVLEELSGDTGLSDNEVMAILSMDLELNAQGLAIWWRKQNG